MKIIITVLILVLVVSGIYFIPRFYCYYKVLDRFKNPFFITLELRIPVDENTGKYVKCRITDKADIDLISNLLGYRIFKTIVPDENSIYRKELGIIEFPGIWSEREGKACNHRVSVFEDGYAFWALAEWNMVYMPGLKDVFIKLRDKYINNFSDTKDEFAR